MLLPTTLCLAAAAALVNIWLVLRIGRLRTQFKVSVGDGGHDLLARRMRAQLNFVENVPLVVILTGLIEFSGKGGLWLSLVAALFMLGRLLHAFGMDGDTPYQGRMIGTATAMLTQIGLAGVAVLIAARVI
ncbi:MAG: MAPEG family protein [Novosphingobium sp.]|nr:MAPEG family protein [Novosphingobium sp.]